MRNKLGGRNEKENNVCLYIFNRIDDCEFCHGYTFPIVV